MWQLPPLLKPADILMYLRKSRTDDPALSVSEVLSKHEQMLDEWVQHNLPNAGPIPEVNRYREVVSGETIDSRPQVQRLLREIESPRYKAVLIVEPQRLSRGDLEDIGRLVKLLRYSNTIVITLQYTYNLQDERDRDAFERELKRGNEFLEYQKRIMLNGRLLSVENGNFIGNTPPYGYRKIRIKEGKKTCYTLEPIPEEAAVVRQIFEWYAQGLGSHTIARKLNEMGIPSPRGSKWSPESMKKIRSNVHYIGMVRWNHRKTVKSIEDGKLKTSRPVNNDCLVYPGKHEPIIDRELWDAVQDIRNQIPPVKSKVKCVNPFAGLVYCQCGRAMTKRTYKRNGEERSASRLLCVNQVECGNASCTVDEMTNAVIQVLNEAIADFQVHIDAGQTDNTAFYEQSIIQLEKRLDELNQLELAQWDKYTKEGMPKHIFDQLNERVVQERGEVEEALQVARTSVPVPVDYENKRIMFSEAVKLLQDPGAPALEKNLLLKKCIERITYSRKRKEASGNRRWGEPEPLELDIQLKI